MSDVLEKLANNFPFCRTMGIGFHYDEARNLIGEMPFQPHLIGNPLVPALHGGGIAGFMEATALASLVAIKAEEDEQLAFEKLPKTINVTADYLRPGLSKDSFARATIHRMGRRYASVHVLAWQDDASKPIAENVGHFLIADWYAR